MDIRQQILHFYRVEELSLREISRKTGADRKTVTRLINAFEAAIKDNPETGIDEFLAYPIACHIMWPERPNPAYDVIKGNIYVSDGKDLGVKVIK